MLDLQSPNFLGGNNVHHLIIIGMLAYVIYECKK